jgi:hypothetical protein
MSEKQKYIDFEAYERVASHINVSRQVFPRKVLP